jgi:UDP-N-acetylglucosamine 2-epimerase (non-hydrolysing)
MTTVVGSFFGRLLGATIGHVEAGLRSFDWRNPFPEELNRIIVTKLAQIHFAPDVQAVENLVGAKGLVVCTKGNTISDQVFKELGQKLPEPVVGSVLVLLHRVELINNRKAIDDTFSVLIELSQHYRRIFMVFDAFALASISDLSSFIELSRKSTVVISGKVDHKTFLDELLKCEFVITDSGGVQEEAAALGIPCIIHRVKSERMDGLGPTGSAVITGLNSSDLLRFSFSPPQRKAVDKPIQSPTESILEVLTDLNYLTSTR